MKYALIVAETNPLHYGHTYLIDTAKSNGYRVIVLMSASFTQRGLPVVVDKFTRAKDLLEHGVDLVITLPVQIATSYGEMFSKGSMFFANRLKNIDAIYCGSEWGDSETFCDILNFEDSVAFKKSLSNYLSKGLSYSTAFRESLIDKNKQWQQLFQSNALLAYGYYKALQSISSPIQFKPIKRVDKWIHPLLSASSIRVLSQTNLTEAKTYCAATPPMYIEKDLSNRLYYLYRSMLISKTLNLCHCDGYENGIEHRIEAALKNAGDFNTFLERAKSKRHSKWRISRLLLHGFLNIQSSDVRQSLNNQQAFQVLAFNEIGRHFLSKCKHSDIKLLTNFKKIHTLNEEQSNFLKLESHATDLWSLLVNDTFAKDYYRK